MTIDNTTACIFKIEYCTCETILLMRNSFNLSIETLKYKTNNDCKHNVNNNIITLVKMKNIVETSSKKIEFAKLSLQISKIHHFYLKVKKCF